MIQPVGKSQSLCQLLEICFVWFLVVQKNREQNVLTHVQGWNQVVELVDDSYFSTAEDGELFKGQGRDIGVFYIDIAICRAVYTSQYVQECGFSGAGGSHYGGKTAAFQGKSYVIEGCNGFAALTVGFCQVVTSDRKSVV